MAYLYSQYVKRDKQKGINGDKSSKNMPGTQIRSPHLVSFPADFQMNLHDSGVKYAKLEE